jgi:thioredoxin 1
MKKFALISLLLTVVAFGSCSSAGGANDNPADKDGTVAYLSTDNFKKLIWDYSTSPQDWAYKGNTPVVIDFYADWCRPCKMVAPIMEDLAKEYKGKVRFYRVNTDQEKELAQRFNIQSIPAILFIPKDGKPQMAVGAQAKDAYVQAITEFLLKK